MLAAWLGALPILAAKALIGESYQDQTDTPWRVGLRNRLAWQVTHVGAAALPSMILFGSFWLTTGSGVAIRQSFAKLLRNLMILGSLSSNSRWEIIPSVLVTILLLGAGAAGLRRVLARGTVVSPLIISLGLSTAGFLLLYFLSPNSSAGGTWVNARLMLFPFLTAILLLSAMTYSENQKWCLGIGSSAAAILFLGIHLLSVSKLDAAMQDYLECESYIESNSTLLSFSNPTRGADASGSTLSWKVGIFRHASGYVAADRCLVLFDNYAAWKGYFPLSWGEGMNPRGYMSEEYPDWAALQSDVEMFESQSGGHLDYVMIWAPGAASRDGRGSEWLQSIVGTREGVVCSSERDRGLVLTRRPE